MWGHHREKAATGDCVTPMEVRTDSRSLMWEALTLFTSAHGYDVRKLSGAARVERVSFNLKGDAAHPAFGQVECADNARIGPVCALKLWAGNPQVRADDRSMRCGDQLLHLGTLPVEVGLDARFVLLQVYLLSFDEVTHVIQDARLLFVEQVEQAVATFGIDNMRLFLLLRLDQHTQPLWSVHLAKVIDGCLVLLRRCHQ